ncbi:dTDP-4-dehydrorhamnose reductase [Corchorus capsularis]|uniref:dTDP-4-dehydrorhamnose reductase n=1 Tax=Corchorus capsularis TaxID=210143 RepID=A0A1R3J482_COCAP|nr:dTDP-4-dehydrorhamnose reductase [Corchorus capsularis]
MVYEANGNAQPLALGLRFLIYGRTGCIGGLLGKICEAQGIPFAYGSGRLEDRESLVDDIAAVQPSHVFNAAGATGPPHVDWGEFNKTETIKSNVIGALNIADVCREKGLPLIFYSTGCMFDYDSDQPIGSGIGFTENDSSNYSGFGSFYSKTKGMAEEWIKNYENVCILRVRMPLFSDLTHHRNFIKKITGYERVVNIPNSMTVLDELLPISIEMAKRNLTGIWNFTNPGVLTHNQVLEMYRDYVDPDFTWKNFSLEEEQAKVLDAAPRCNNELDSTKLKKEFPEILPIKESAIKYVFQPNKKKKVNLA